MEGKGFGLLGVTSWNGESPPLVLSGRDTELPGGSVIEPHPGPGKGSGWEMEDRTKQEEKEARETEVVENRFLLQRKKKVDQFLWTP